MSADRGNVILSSNRFLRPTRTGKAYV
jgi:hypothetical protein